MSKAILVMDRMPEECRLCRLIDYDYDQLSASCYYLREDVSKNIFADKPIRPPKKCPLREMPEPMYLQGGDYMEYNEGCVDGWNNCLNELEGKHE